MDSATELGNLVSRYAELIDAGDFDGVADLLEGAAVGGAEGPLVGGHDAIRGLFASTARLYPDGTPRTKHVTTNLILDIDEEEHRATARSYWTVLQATEGFALQPILAGRYHDRFARQDGTWRFAERRYLVDLVGDVSAHMMDHRPT